jgi:hypothetical protein
LKTKTFIEGSWCGDLAFYLQGFYISYEPYLIKKNRPRNVVQVDKNRFDSTMNVKKVLIIFFLDSIKAIGGFLKICLVE